MSAIAQTFAETSVLDLAALRRMTYSELSELYRNAKRPDFVSDLDGHARGAMLAWRCPRTGPIAWWLRIFGGSAAFPWEGKSFEGTSEEGTGINRVTFFGKRRWFPFKTRFDASFLDGKPTLCLITQVRGIRR